MSVTSYATLLTEVATRMHRNDLTSIIPSLVEDAEKRIMREVRSHEMEEAYSQAISNGVIAAPANFLGWKAVYVNGSSITMLQTKTLDWLYQNYPVRSADSLPKFIARNGANFEFGPYPDTTYTIKGTYYKRLDSVSSSWNSLATSHPDLYLFATLCEAAPYVKDMNMAPVWEAKYQQIKDSINGEAIDAEYSGAPLAVTAN